MKLPKHLGQKGSILISLLIIIPFLLLTVAHYTRVAITSFAAARDDQFHTHAQFGADAGVDFAMQEINNDSAWAGTAAPVEIHNANGVRVTYEVSVASPDAESKVLTATGRAYSPATDTTPDSTVILTVDLRILESSGDFSIVTGVGGLFLSNSAKIIGGDVFVNGEIDIRNSAQIGLTTNPVDVRVAHQNCPSPADGTYPRICNSGENGEPINIENTAHIYGSVTANNQTSGAGMSGPGLVGSSGVEVQALPSHDRNAQKAAAVNNMTGTAASCSGSQTRNWPANLKITGNVEIKGSCVVTVNGDVWITGTLTLENTSEMIVADSLGETRPNIMVDSKDTKLKNSTKITNNASETGVQIISYWSNAACSPDCADITGPDLFNTRNEVTIELDNSAAGSKTIFYSRWTRVLISNSGQIGALVGQTVELKNSGTVTFGSSVPGGGGEFWVIDGYRRSFN